MEGLTPPRSPCVIRYWEEAQYDVVPVPPRILQRCRAVRSRYLTVATGSPQKAIGSSWVGRRRQASGPGQRAPGFSYMALARRFRGLGDDVPRRFALEEDLIRQSALFQNSRMARRLARSADRPVERPLPLA